MVRLYAFYSVGGYKDMYLGSLSHESSSTYYLPLLSIMKKRNNPAEQEQVAALEKLQSVKIINKENDWGFPNECNTLFSHGGYTIIYKTLCDGMSCMALRNLTGSMRDEEGRSTPFNLLFIAENVEDNYTLDKVAIYCKDHLQKINSILSPTIVYDATVNGLRVDLHNIYNWICSLPDTTPILHNTNRVNYIIVSNEQMIDVVIKEHHLSHIPIDAILHDNGYVLRGSLKYANTLTDFAKSADTLMSSNKRHPYNDGSKENETASPQGETSINNTKEFECKENEHPTVINEIDIPNRGQLDSNNFESANSEDIDILDVSEDNSFVTNVIDYFKRLFNIQSQKECIKIFSIHVPIEYVQWFVLGVAIISFLIGLIF